MKASYSEYKFLDSVDRIKEILDSSDNNFEEKDSIPSRDSLTYTNGFYVNCSAMFVDIRGSKEMTEKYRRPTLARIYRTYISELVAIMKEHPKVSEINIQGDCVWGVFDTPYEEDINGLFSISAKISSAIDIMNWRFEKKKYDPIEVGIGLDYGRALMIKAGYSGSGINDVVWMGDVVNQASALCSAGNKDSNKETQASKTFYQNLNKHNKGLLSYDFFENRYEGDIVNPEMNGWLKKQKEKEKPKSLLAGLLFDD